MKYKVVKGLNIDDLNKEVNKWMKKGWIPFSSPTVIKVNENYGWVSMAQALIKED